MSGGGEAVPAECRLTEVPLGERVRIAAIDLPPADRTRLLEMGLTVGAACRPVRTAPLGDPLEVEVRGYHLSLRRSEASGVRVVRAGGGGR